MTPSSHLLAGPPFVVATARRVGNFPDLVSDAFRRKFSFPNWVNRSLNDSNIPVVSGSPAILLLAAPLRLMRCLRPLAGGLIRSLTREKRSGSREGFQLAIVIPLAEDAGHEATRLQIGILRKFGRNPGLDAYPHITLKLGFQVSDFAPFEESLGQLAGESPPFEISLRNFGFFEEGVMFLDVEANPELENLRQRILAGLSERHGISPEEIEDSRYHFHVTLAYGLSSQEFAELRKSFDARELHFKFLASHIDLLCHTGHQWVTYRRARLRGSASPAS